MSTPATLPPGTSAGLCYKLGACPDAVAYAKTIPDPQEAWDKCQRGDWMLWFAAKRGADRKALVRAACECARLALPHARSPETLRCIEITEAWTRGEAMVEQVRTARNAVCAATKYALSVNPFYAAAAAAYATYAKAHADAANAVYAATSLTASAIYVITFADITARARTLAQCADIARKYFPLLP